MSSAESAVEEGSVQRWAERVWLARAVDLVLRIAPFLLAPTTTTTTVAPTTTTTTTTTTTIPAPPTPTGLGIVVIDPSITSLAEDQTESADVQLFRESGPTVLAAPLVLETFAPTDPWTSSSNPQTETLPAGTSVCSWFLHYDGLGAVLTNHTMEADFGSPILGVAVNTIPLDDTASFAEPTVDYATTDDFDPSELVWIDGSVMKASFVSTSADQARVFVSC